MQWSKLKRRVESLFAPSVASRVELRMTNYRKVADWEGRAWITIDKKEVWNFCTLKYFVERGRLVTGIRAANGATSWSGPKAGEYYAAIDVADDILEKQGLVSQYYFEGALESYLQVDVADALASDNLVHRALAVLDRRLGKRRLVDLTFRTDEHELVRRLYRFRLAAEGIQRSEPAALPTIETDVSSPLGEEIRECEPPR